MRAAVIREYGRPPEVGEFDEPQAADGQEVVEVLAGGLNPVDLRIASGSFYGGAPDPPYVAGREGVGRTADGRRVYFDGPVTPHGSFAQRSLIDPSTAVEIPDGLDEALATALGVAGLAAWLALEWRAELSQGETVLVLGASGVVGQIAVQGARLLGAGRVVAAARSEDGLARAAELGADATVRLAADADTGEAMREAAGDGGYDVVIDPVWGAPASAAVDALAFRGRLVQIGESAGETASLKSASVRGKMVSILGHTNFAVPADVRQTAYRTMAEHAAAGELNVDVERVPLADAAEAWERQRSSPHHKLAIVP